jgi:hypothetical protein
VARKATAIVTAVATVAGATAAMAASAPKEGKELPPSMAIQRTSLKPPSIITETVGALKISITQVMYPGVPDRAACRFVVRATNDGRATVSANALLRTLNAEKGNLNSWNVPTGSLAPGETAERLYSCKTAHYVVLDQDSLSNWPGRCTVNGEERSPCPLGVSLEANLNIIAKQP